MKKTKLSKSFIAAFIALTAIGIGTTIAVSSVIAESYNEDTENVFTYIDGSGFKYDVYPLISISDPTGKVPVSLSYKGKTGEVLSTINVPETFQVGGTGSTYITYSISEAAFAYKTEFTSINLPNSVKKIKTAAFIGCTNLESFSVPYHVTEIEASTFMDCRKLETFEYRDSSGNSTTNNDRITSIGNHAFTSCVSLQMLELPSSITYIGKSAFQGCSKLIRAIFSGTENVVIDQYAYSNCPMLNLVYISDRVTSIGDYAFTLCPKLTIYTSYSSETNLDNAVGPSKLYRKTLTNNKQSIAYVKVVTQVSNVSSNSSAPDFIYTIITGRITVTGTHTSSSCTYCVLQNSTQYISIIGYSGKEGVDTVNFDSSTGTLTIPNTIEGKNVCVLQTAAFEGHTEIKKIVFNENLVKIEEKAFHGVTEIEELDFNNCTHLKEIGAYAFGTDGVKDDVEANRVGNTKLKNLKLPASLFLLDGRAFRYFYALETLAFKTDADIAFGRECNLIAIGRRCFQRCGEQAEHKDTCDLVLPHSMSDKKVNELSVQCGLTTTEDSSSDINQSKGEPYVLGMLTFGDSRFLHSVSMEQCPDGCTRHKIDPSKSESEEQQKNNFDSVSYGNSSFKHTGIRYFISEPYLYRMHIMCFQKNYWMHSAVLYANMGYDRTKDPLGADKKTSYFDLTGSVGDTDKYSKKVAWKTGCFAYSPNVVAYVNFTEDKLAPRSPSIRWTFDSSNDKLQSVVLNQTGSYVDKGGFNYNGRLDIPVHYGIEDMDAVKAMVRNSANDYHVIERTDGSGNKYSIITNYQNPSTEVNLSTIASQCASRGAPIKEIGPYAFANVYYYNFYYNSNILDTDHEDNRGAVNSVINIPSTLTTIGEGAFFSVSNDNGPINEYSLQKITTGNGTESVTYTAFNSSSSTTITNNYCKLPTSVTSIGKRAFKNNRFKYVDIPGEITFLGSQAFTIDSKQASARTPLTESFNVGNTSSNTIFEEQNCLYYKASSTEYFLLDNYKYNFRAKTTYVQNIKQGTTVIAPQAFYNSNARKFNFPSSLHTIYGQAFNKSYILEATGDLSGLKYISCPTGDESTEAYSVNNEAYKSSILWGLSEKYTSYSNDSMYSYGAFRGCGALATMNFSSMSSLIGVGKNAFDGCNALVNCTTAGVGYTYKQCDSNGTLSLDSSTSENLTSTIIDLRESRNLRQVLYSAFGSCGKIKYFHLPNTVNGNFNVESNMKMTDKFSGVATMQIFVGETATQASSTQTSLNASSHYTATTWSSTKAVYYFASSSSDVIQSGADSLNYWTYGKNDDGTINKQVFIMMKTKAVANKYFETAANQMPAGFNFYD